MEKSSLHNLLIMVLILVAIGYILRRRGFIDEPFKKKLGDLLLRVVVPMGIISTGNNPFSPQIAQGLVWCAVFAAGYFVFSLALMALLTRPMRLDRANKGLMSTLVVFANVALLGYPLAAELFGSEGVLYTVVHNLFGQLFLGFFAPRLLSPSGKANLRTSLREPLLVAAALSIALFVSPFRLPVVVASTFGAVGAMSVPISMMIVGCTVAEIKFRSIFTRPGAYFINALRLLALPVLMLAALRALGFGGTLVGVFVLLSALPVGSLNVILAEKYGADVPFAAATLVQSMVFMLLSLPLVLFLLEL